MVCVKFPAASVDESYLRKLTEPFGKIVKILMFSSLVGVCRGLGRVGRGELQTAELVLNPQAFVELGSVEQAKDLVKLYENQPVTVNGQQVEFKMSHTFSFLQVSLTLLQDQLRTRISQLSCGVPQASGLEPFSFEG